LAKCCRAVSAPASTACWSSPLLAVFVAGLMVGRTPEFLGKKIEGREMKYAMLAVLILPLAILGFTRCLRHAALRGGLASAPPARMGFGDPLCLYVGGRQQRLGLRRPDGQHPWYNTTLGIAMLLGRFAYVVPVLAIAGSLAAKVKVPPSPAPSPPMAALRRPARRHHPHPGRPAILPGTRPRPHRRAFRDAGRQTF
jgi:hypothetical protein